LDLTRKLGPSMGFGVSTLRAAALVSTGAPGAARLPGRAAVVVRSAAAPDEAGRLAARVLAARASWTPDFGGEQFALGRAFYTHLETGRTRDYFAGAAASDALVEAVLPGLARRTLELLARLLGGEVRRRPGFCGPGVHVFPARGKVAREGGVVHFDLEGLTEQQKSSGARAVTLVWMLRPPAFGGGLRLWDALYDGRPDSEVEPDDHVHVTVRSGAGDAVLIDSRRLHQIRPFRGDVPRISITAHAVEVDAGVWEAWF
jgi:2-oxoglutarate-Fe(II)-dependent oxygenase superfamily protein